MGNLKFDLALYIPFALMLATIPLALMGDKLRSVYPLSKALEAFVTRVGQVVAWIALALIVVIMFDVITRRIQMQIPGFGSTKLQELQWHIHGVLMMMCFGYAYLKNAHVRIELLRDNFPMRTRAWVEMVGIWIMVLPYCYLMIILGFEFAQRSFIQNEVSDALTGLSHRFIIKSFIPIGFVLITLAALSVWLRCVIYLFGPADLKDGSSSFLRPAEMAPDAMEGH